MTEDEIDLFDAVQKNDISKVQSLIAAGVDVNAEDDYQWIPLHLAAYNGHTEIVKLLIAAEADVNAEDQCQLTPLYWANASDNTEIAKLLKQYGATE